MSHLDEGLLTAMLDGEIPSAELPAIRAHLDRCAECRARLEDLRGLLDQAGTLITMLGDGTTGTVDPAAVIPIPRRSRTRHHRLLAWAATVVLAAGLGYWMRGPGGAPMGGLSDRAVGVPGAVAFDEGAAGNQAAPGGEAVEPVRPPVPTPGRRVGVSEESSPPASAPPPVVVEDAPTALGRAAVRTDAGAAKVAERLVSVPDADLRASELRSASGAPPAAPAAVGSEATVRQEVALESFVPISFVDAVARMGGTLRLVDGLVPDRLEASTTTVRVIYPLRSGELVLEQRRRGDSISVALRGPVSAESLAVLRRRVR